MRIQDAVRALAETRRNTFGDLSAAAFGDSTLAVGSVEDPEGLELKATGGLYDLGSAGSVTERGTHGHWSDDYDG